MNGENKILELNEEIKKALENIKAKERYTVLINKTNEELLGLREKWEELKEQLIKEEHDVEKLTKISFSNFLHSVLNDKQEKIDKEQKEALQAKVKCENALIQLRECENRINILNNKYKEVENSDKEYNRLIQDKKSFIKEFIPDKWKSIEANLQRISNNSIQLKEINEAISEGNILKSYIDFAKASLKSALNWGTLDMFGGGLLTTMAKRSKMDEAQRNMNNMISSIKSFTRELNDIDEYVELDLQIDSFLGFADYFFDGLLVDWMVQSKIRNSYDKVNSIDYKVDIVMEKLQNQKVNITRENEKLNDDISIIVQKI